MHTEPIDLPRTPKTTGNLIRWAPFYDAVVWLVSLGKGSSIRKKTAELAQIKTGERVLDVGCGTGDLTMVAKEFAGVNGEVVGTDASEAMIEVARRKASRSGRDISYSVEPIENISFPDNYFNVILSSLMMHHLSDDLKTKGLAEAYRVLKPGGRLLIVDIESSTGGSWLKKFSDFMIQLHGGHAETRNYVKRLIPMVEAIGFRKIESDKLNRQLSFVTAIKTSEDE